MSQTLYFIMILAFDAVSAYTNYKFNSYNNNNNYNSQWPKIMNISTKLTHPPTTNQSKQILLKIYKKATKSLRIIIIIIIKDNFINIISNLV